MAEQYKIIHPVKYYRDYLNQKIRPDGREFDKFRPIGLNIGSVTTADGSAVVRIGNTIVVCGIRAELAKPKASDPENGYLVPNIELISFCNSKYRAGSPEDAETYTCALNDIILNSDCVDLKELCVVKDKLVWCLYCDVSVLDHDGSVLDAALVAVITALKNLKLPKVNFNVEIEKITVDQTVKKGITVKALPVATTLMLFEDNVIITDPTSEEENLSSSIITIAVCNSEVCFILKPGGTPFSQDQMDVCIKQALSREKAVLKLFKENFKK